MALITRYFGVTGNGNADGTTWNDRAALFSSGNWSSVITGFDFSGSDSMLALIGPGTHTCGQALASGLFSNAPTTLNSLILHGCDSSGVKLSPSNPGWTSAQPVDWDSNLPVIESTTNIIIGNLAASCFRLLKIRSSGRPGAIIGQCLFIDWCYFENSTENASAGCIISPGRVTNTFATCSGNAYNFIFNIGNDVSPLHNVRIIGVTGTSGNRNGLAYSGAAGKNNLIQILIANCGGAGFISTSGSNNANHTISRSTFVNNGGSGIQFPNTIGQLSTSAVERCVIVGNGGYGINPGGANTILYASRNRIRDNGSGPFGTFGNLPTDFDNDTSSGTNGDEFVNAAGGDYRIKAGSSLWGKNFGIADEPAGGGGLITHPGMSGGING